ncbi:hypothetical protein [Burkholderia ubonensis]|uniref:hypothetical protein n=1 Tax=Burkholderia ubonensis TaxID=101571 RepID=UPI0007579519|nr:hypothetical protein [Burkholderia ubonensis]KVP17286.1 hypothetical protein WJ84_03385 [Burkholderia ubonensis]
MAGLLGRASSHDVEGVVIRVGPWFGPGVDGIVLTLDGHTRPYVVLRDDQAWRYPVGLTQPGDEVTLRARPAQDFYTVELSTFRNTSLERTMPLLAKVAP